MNEPPRITSRVEFGAAVRWGLETAIARGARRVWCTDPHFADWPLDEPALLDPLTVWLRLPQRRLVLLAEDYDELPRRHPRFVAWRRSWTHAIDTWSPSEAPTELPTLLVDDGPVVVMLADRVHWRGRAALDPREARLCRERTDAVLQRSEPAFPANQLGL